MFDRRVVARYVASGLVKEAEFNSHLKNLPDDTNNAQWVQMDLHDAELGEGSLNGSLDSDSEGTP